MLYTEKEGSQGGSLKLKGKTMTTTQPALLHTALFPLNEEKTAYKIDLGGAVQYLNTAYRLTVANSGMTEEAWDALNAHLSMLESFVRAIQEEYFN